MMKHISKISNTRENNRVSGADPVTDLRHAIDAVDDQIVSLLGERNHLTQRVLAIKFQRGLPLHSPERERQIVTRVRWLAIQQGMESGFITRVFEVILRQFAKPGD